VVAGPTGNFTINLPAGTYALAAMQAGYVASKTTAPKFSLSANQTLTGKDITLAPATCTISGKTQNLSGNATLMGVQLSAKSATGDVATASSDPDGNFVLATLPGKWEITASDASMNALGYLRPGTDPAATTTAGNTTALDLSFTAATSMVYGTVKTPAGAAMPGVLVESEDSIDNADSLYSSNVTTDADGKYFLGMTGTTSWRIKVSTQPALSPYVMPPNKWINPPPNTATQVNFATQQVTAHLQGTVTKSGQPLPIPPSLSTTNNDPALQRAITNYNAASYAYGNLITSDLSGRVNAYTGGLYRFTWAFAAHIWHGSVDRYRFSVLKELGESKQFLVLRTYKFQKLPDWAVQSMQSSAGQYIYQTVYSRNMGSVQSLVQGTIIASEYQQLLNQYQIGGGPADPTVQRYLQRQAELAAAPEVAAAVAVAVQQGAAQISLEVASEWVARPWAYEITPPDQVPTKHQGVLMADRISYFSWLAGAQSKQAPPRVLPAAFGTPRDPLVAYAQAEIFNWNEFSSAWGQMEQLDQVTRHVNQLSSNFNGVVSGSPAFWRLSNTGGWNWQPRLSNADALSPALTKNPEFVRYFTSAGLTPDSDARSLRDINLH
ncbi:MAG: carboxypeptidase-like regulatory domain-containing protein, partial [Phycisphaerae bacterium]